MILMRKKWLLVLHADVVKHIKCAVCNLETHCRLESVALWKNEKGCLRLYARLRFSSFSDLVSYINVLRHYNAIFCCRYGFGQPENLSLFVWWRWEVGWEELLFNVLLPLQKGLKMKPTAKSVICKLTIFACIFECGCKREEAPVLAHHLFSVSSWTLRSESSVCMDGFSFVLC